MYQLPFLNVPYAHRSFDALQISNVLTHTNGREWLSDHYIDIYIHNDYEKLAWDGFLDSDKLFQCPFVIYNCISKTNLFTIKSDIKECFITLLDHQNYILCSVNKYYIPMFNEYNKEKIPHHIIISGYDLESQTFIISDFISGKFEHVSCGFKDLVNSVMECGVDNFDRIERYIPQGILHQYFDSIVMLKVDHNIKYKFNKQLLINSLERYVLGITLTGLDYIPYGYDLYKLSFGSKVLKVYMEKTKDSQWINIRPLYLMKMHKEVMRDRLEYLVRNQYIRNNVTECIEGNNELIKLFTQIMMLALKCNTNGSTESKIIRMHDMINLAMEKDIDNANLILENLNNS